MLSEQGKKNGWTEEVLDEVSEKTAAIYKVIQNMAAVSVASGDRPFVSGVAAFRVAVGMILLDRMLDREEAAELMRGMIDEMIDQELKSYPPEKLAEAAELRRSAAERRRSREASVS